MPTGLILVTGARGFLARRLCRELSDAGYGVRATVRTNPPADEPNIEYRASGDIGGTPDWRPLLAGVDAVVHAAARVHIQGGQGPEALAAYRRDNVTASEHLAQQAAAAGVRRLVYLSSIKAAEAERNESKAARLDPYGFSKLEAERALIEFAAATGLEVAVLRPPLVYGPGATANFALLARAVARGIPLPLASIRNRRSFIFIDNLCSAVASCLEHDAAPGGVFEVSDGAPCSTPEFVRALGLALGKPARLWPCPASLLRAVAGVLGRGAAADSLTGDLVADDRLIRERLGWRAPANMADALQATFATLAQGAPR